MNTKLALAIATLTISCGAFAAGPAAATTWSGRHHAKGQAKQLANGWDTMKHWANKQGTTPLPNKEDVAAEIGANRSHARKAMREGSMQNMQGMHVGGKPS